MALKIEVPLNKVPRGHQERMFTLVMRDKRKRREKDRRQKELRSFY